MRNATDKRSTINNGASIMNARRSIAILAILANSCLAARAQDHLEPEEGAINTADYHFSYATKIRETLLKGGSDLLSGTDDLPSCVPAGMGRHGDQGGQRGADPRRPACLRRGIRPRRGETLVREGLSEHRGQASAGADRSGECRGRS